MVPPLLSVTVESSPFNRRRTEDTRAWDILHWIHLGESAAGLFSFPVEVFSMADEEDDERAVFAVADDAIVTDTEAILADVRPDERLCEP